MDDANEGYLLIGTAMIILTAFLLTVLAIMIIYRKRKLQHVKEVDQMNEKFSHEILQTQLEVQQQTMQHIGREIHDNVGQKLTLASLYLEQLNAANKNPLSQKKITSITLIINESLHDLRSLSKNLTDTGNLDTGLFELISNECKNVNATGLCAVALQTNTKHLRVSQAVKNFVLRILQEFLQNSLKHANCSEIKIELLEQQTGLTINAFDNGKGFITSNESQAGIGLKNIKKRAELIGAELIIQSTPGKGTNLHLFIPVNKFNV